MLVLVGILICAVLLSAVLLYGCVECMRRGSLKPSPNSTRHRSGSSASSPTLELNQMNQESSHFARSFMLTLIEHLFGEQSRHSTLNCGILLVPEQRPVEHLLRVLKIDDSRTCKAPVTHKLLDHYGSAPIGCSRKRKYLVMQSGYIHAHDVNASDLPEGGEGMVTLARRHGFVVIDCARKRTTGDTQRWYLRTCVMGTRVRSAEQFVSGLEQYGIAIQLGVAEDERTRTWRVRESMRLDSSFNRVDSAHDTYEESSALVRAVEHLQMHAEDVGATIVVIPADKDMSDYKAYVRSYLPVSIEVNGGTLLSIFKHSSPLHDGPIFVRGDRIIAVKAFFRLTGDSDTVSIGHGTRHASVKEFSKHAFEHRTIVLVLSEEDGRLRSCVDGVLHKISTDNIGKLVAEQQHCRNDSRRKPTAITDVCVHRGANMLELQSTTSTDSKLSTKWWSPGCGI